MVGGFGEVTQLLHELFCSDLLVDWGATVFDNGLEHLEGVEGNVGIGVKQLFTDLGYGVFGPEKK